MMIRKKMALIIFAIFMMLTSCEKFLDQKSNTSLTVPTSLTDLQALLDAPLNMNLGTTPTTGEVSSDDYFILDASFNSLSNQRDKDIYRWIPNSLYSLPNDWSLSYKGIFTANYCLEMIDKVDASLVNKLELDNVKGSALFYRSYNFLQLVWVYAKAYDPSSASSDPGIALRTSSDFNIPSTRASVKDTYEKIISDTKLAIDLLPQTPVHPYRPSKAACYGLLARAYLSMRDYDNALIYSGLYLQSKNELVNFNGDSNLKSPNDPFPFNKFNKEIAFYTDMGYNSVTISLNFLKVDPDLYSSYAVNDLRKQVYFRANGIYFGFKGNYTTSYNFFSGIATDEIYLIRSECNARKGNISLALADLNTLLAKRYNSTFTPVIASDSNDALKKILVERRKELAFRGLRFIDIKRLNKEGANIVLSRKVNGTIVTLSPNDNRYALPLPGDIIEQSGMPQNNY